MKVYGSDKIRNVAILGHSGSGKTTIAEAALFASGVTSRVGRVEDGTTVSDYDPEEIRRRVSISASVIPIEWNGSKINLIDAPGYFDFAGEVKQALRAADLALIVVSGKSGVEVGTEKAWEYAGELGLARMFFVNGMDDENADFDKVVGELQDMFGKSIAPIVVPIRTGGKFSGFVNVLANEARILKDGRATTAPVPAETADDVETMRAMITEAVAETSEELMEKFFEEEPFTAEELEQGLRDGVASGVVTPALCGSATGNIGVAALLDAIAAYLPPAGVIRPSISAENARTGEPVVVKTGESEPFSAFVFKTIADPYVGRVSLFRVCSGAVRKDTPLYNSKKDITEKVTKLIVMRGKEQIEVEEIRAGDIGAIAKLTGTGTQDTLCARERPVVFPDIAFPAPLYSMAVAAKGKGDEDKIFQGVGRLLDEDKTLRFTIDPETKESVLYGIGDSHLDVVVNKLRNRNKLEIDLVTPTVPYREMLKSKIKVQGKHKKQSGGHGQYGDVWIEFEPSGDNSTPYVFEEKIFGGSVPKGYFPAVEKGIQDCVKAGPIAGYPVVGIKATLVDGSYHDVDSSEMAFKLATSLAFKAAFEKGRSAILEPIAKVEVTVPDDYTGDIMGDMNKRRGRILGMGKNGDKQVISVEAPMGEMFKYAIDLRSMTQGRGDFSMTFDRYEEASPDVQAKVIADRKNKEEK
ncbi:MAG: elongation factor G [Clostridiales bacterium]|jgi:elongation factor G|nr:elongation factor G [Clostridiales bacterium]